METVLVTLLVITAVLFGALTLAYRYLAAQDMTVRSSREMEERVQERARTALDVLRVETRSSGETVEVALKNVGSTKLADFERWDVLLQYYDDLGAYHAQWYPYSPHANAWTVQGIYLVAPGTAEGYEPGILNPGEEAVLRISLSPVVGPGSMNWVTVATPNGITASAVFTR